MQSAQPAKWKFFILDLMKPYYFQAKEYGKKIN